MKTVLNKSVLYTISFLDLLAVGLIIPLLPVHLRSLGASHVLIGILGSAYAAVQVLSGPIIGSFSDVTGRKHILLISLILSSLLYAALGITKSLFVIFFVRLTLGLVKHTQTLCKALIVDSFSPKDHATILGKMTALGSIGFVVGPFVGGHLYKFVNGFAYVCYISSFMFLVNIALSFKLPESKTGRKKNALTLETKTLNKLIKDMFQPAKDLLKINWITYGDGLALKFLFGFTISIYYSSYSLYMSEKFDLSQIYIGYIISFQGTIGAASSFLIGKINATIYNGNINCQKRISHAFNLLSFSLICLYFSPNIYAYISFLIPFAMASAFVRVISTEMLITNSKESERGMLSGTSNSIMSLARMLAPISSGLVNDIFGKDSVILFALLPSLLGTILAYRVCTKKTKTS